jgi:hypothetical protein
MAAPHNDPPTDADELLLVHRALRDAEQALASVPQLELERDRAHEDVRVSARRIAQLERDRDDLLADARRLRAELDSVYGSISWRVTRPLRALRPRRRRRRA